MPEINSEENWRYRTLSKLEILFHVTNVTTVLNASVVSDRVSRYVHAVDAAVCFCVLLCFAVCCCVLQCLAVCCSVW